MIELYGSPTPSSYTIAIMLEEIGLEYVIFPVTKDHEVNQDLKFFKTTATNVFPLIVDRTIESQVPVMIFEAGAILMYLAEKSKKFLPEPYTNRFEVLQWLLFGNSKIGPTLNHTKHFMFHAPEEIPYAVKRFNNEAKRVFGIINDQLLENDYLAGEYSIADISIFPWAKEYDRYGIASDQIPNIMPWLEKVEQRKAVSRALETVTNLKD